MTQNKRIFIIGQCTLHWGRMEFGNIGNYYIIEPLFRELRRVFNDYTLTTTMQFSDDFCGKYGIEMVPMECYFDFNSDSNLETAKREYDAVCNGEDIGSCFVSMVKKSDLVIDFSGDIWGDNADLIGKDRFETGCYKDLIAQKLKPTVMLAGSPGPFGNKEKIELAKKVYEGFDIVTNREPISTRILENMGFDLSRTYDYPCPSFLFNKSEKMNLLDIMSNTSRLKVGFILCGWNFKRGPYSAWPRLDEEYDTFAESIEYMVNAYSAEVYLMSHSNGFEVPPKEFKMIHGRDYPIVKQLHEIMIRRGYGDSVKLLSGVYMPDETKKIISGFDILISGRMHGAVAGISQAIPTLILDYGHEPKAHKLRGFAEVAGIDKYICDPNNKIEVIKRIDDIIKNSFEIHEMLNDRMVSIKNESQRQFDLISELL